MEMNRTELFFFGQEFRRNYFRSVPETKKWNSVSYSFPFQENKKNWNSLSRIKQGCGIPSLSKEEKNKGILRFETKNELLFQKSLTRTNTNFC